MSYLTDAQVVSWAVRLYSSWIDKSPVTYAAAVDVTMRAVRSGRRISSSGKYLRREAAMALIDALQEAGPSTLQETL